MSRLILPVDRRRAIAKPNLTTPTPSMARPYQISSSVLRGARALLMTPRSSQGMVSVAAVCRRAVLKPTITSHGCSRSSLVMRQKVFIGRGSIPGAKLGRDSGPETVAETVAEAAVAASPQEQSLDRNDMAVATRLRVR